MNEERKPLDKLTDMENVLDKLVEATGRTKCGYIWVLTHLVSDLRNDFSAMEAQLALLKTEQQESE